MDAGLFISKKKIMVKQRGRREIKLELKWMKNRFMFNNVPEKIMHVVVWEESGRKKVSGIYVQYILYSIFI